MLTPPDALTPTLSPGAGLSRRRFSHQLLAGGAAAVGMPAGAQRAPAAAPAVADQVAWPAAPAPLAAQHRRAFTGLAARIDQQLPDVQSLAVLHRGHLAFEHYRAGITAATL